MAALGSLVVSLEANTAKFTAGMDKAAYQTEKSMRQMKKDAEMVGAAIGTMAVVGAGALTATVKMTIDAADSLRDMSQKTGIAVETLNGLGFAAGQAGGNLESMVAAAGKLNKTIAEAGSGEKKASEAFRALGISVLDAEGNLKKADVMMAEIADKFEGFQDGPEKSAIALALFSKAGADMIPQLNEGGEKMRENIEYAKQYSSQTTALSEASDNFNDTMGKLTVQQDSFANSMTSAVLPILQAVADETLGAAEASNKFSLASNIVRNVLETFVVVGSEVAFVFKGVGTEIGGIAAQLSALAHGDIKGFNAISEAMKSDAELARKEHDKFIAHVMDRTPVVSVAPDGAPATNKPNAPRMRGANADEADKKMAAAAKKAADEAKRLVDEQKRAVEAIDNQVSSLQIQAETFGKTTKEATLYKLGLDGASESQIKLAAAALDSIEASEKQKKSMDDAKRVFDETRTPLEKLNAEYKRLNALRDAGSIDSDTYSRAAKAAQDNFEKQTDEMKKVMDNFTENVQRNLGDGLYDMLNGNFKSIGDGFKSMMLRMVADAMAAKLTSAMFGGTSGGSSSSGGLFGTLLNAGLSIFSGGADTASATGSTGFGVTYSAAGGFDIPAGTNPVTQLHEKEMVLPREQADVIRGMASSKSSGSSGGVNVSVTVDAGGSSVEGDGQKANQLGAMIGNTVRSILVQEQMPGGILA